MANDEKNDAGVTGAQAKVLASSLAEPVPILLDVATSQGILTQEDAQQMVDSTLDKSLPRNWSDTRKLLVIVVISGMSFIVNLSTVICAPASIQISQDFNSHSDFFAIFYITVWNLGEAIAPLYIGPLSERSGRLKVYHFYNVLFIIFTAVTGFSNSIGMIVAFRFLTGMSTTSICLNPSIVGDMYSLESRGAAMSIMSLMPLVGTAVGPIIGGYVTQRMSWRWTFWLTAILTGIVEITIIIVFRETYTPHILRQRKKAQAKSSTSELGEKMRESKVKARKSPFAALRFLLKPFPLLLSSRSATIISLYLSVVYAYLFLFAANLATVFQEVYLFSESNSGLVYLGLAAGMFIGTLFCRFTLDRSIASVSPPGIAASDESTVDGRVPSEKRLLPIIPAMAILPAALLIYGWTLEYRVHWVAPTVATVLAGFCLSVTTIPIMSYLVDVFGDVSASAIAAVLPLRYLVGTFLPVAAPYMYKRLGYGWANTLMALVLIICLPAPLLIVYSSEKNVLWAKVHQRVRRFGNGPSS